MTGLIDAASTEVMYAAGDWTALCGPRIWLLVSAECADDIVSRLETALPHGLGVDAALEALISHGLAKTPSFAVLGLASQDRRVVTRGSAAVHLTGTRRCTVQAPGAVTWTDMVLADDVAEVLLGSPEMDGDVEWNEVRSARAGAQALRIAVATPPAQPQPVAEPESPDSMWGATLLGSALPNLTDAEADAIAAATEQALSDAASAGAPPDPAVPSVIDYDAPKPPSSGHAGTALPPVGEVIDSVPWATPARPLSPPVPHRPPAQPALGEQASIASPPPPTPAPSRPMLADTSSEPVTETVNRAAVRSLAGGPMVLAAQCPAGHVTSVIAPRCRACRQPVPQQDGFQTMRPALGVLRLSTGDVVTLDRGVVFGRAPEAHAASSADRPNVMRLHSPHNDLSRTHAEIVLDEWNVYVRDLDSTNGTTVTLPGQAPTRLRPRDLFLLESGAVVNLADEVNILFEVTL